jgi:hypothetical protein
MAALDRALSRRLPICNAWRRQARRDDCDSRAFFLPWRAMRARVVSKGRALRRAHPSGRAAFIVELAVELGR